MSWRFRLFVIACIIFLAYEIWHSAHAAVVIASEAVKRSSPL
jgi:hypothetical protein